MTASTVRITDPEFTAEEVLELLDAGNRVLLTSEIVSPSTDVSIRKRDGEYLCDTGIKLLQHADREEMKRCIEGLQLSPRE